MRCVFLLSSLVLMAADSSAVCDGGDAARRELRRWRTHRDIWPPGERRNAIDELAKRHPAAMNVQLARISFYHYESPAEFPALRQELVRTAEAKPDDAFALTLAAAALHGSKTPRAIELARQALRLQPGYPWAALRLAQIQHEGKFENKEDAKANFETFINACPTALSDEVSWVMAKVGTPASRTKVAKSLREWLDQESNPDDLTLFEQLWGLEFRTTPPQEHPALRKRLAADLERMIQANPKPDVMYLWLLRNGAKQAEAPELVAKFGDRIHTEFSRSLPASAMAYENWMKANPQPKDPKDQAAWDAWRKSYSAITKQWAAQFTDSSSMKFRYVAAATDAKELDKKEVIALAEEILQERRQRGDMNSWSLVSSIEFLTDRGWSDPKTLAWAKEAWPLAEDEDKSLIEDDTMPDAEVQSWRENGRRQEMIPAYLKALLASGQRDVPVSLRAMVMGPLPGKKSRESRYYRNLALLAQVDQRKADALAYYQAALLTREKAPVFYRGQLKDELLDDAKALYLSHGGTEAAFQMWSTPRGGDAAKTENAQGRWTKPNKPLPAFELSDLSGKTWKLKQLEGRSVLINLWATWCGPCRAELPHFQELYEKTRERTDVQVLTFNIDEELGLVAPFMKENKFTFPVLMAHGFTRELLDGIGIPQNWLVDGKGKWLWTQIGFDGSDADWVNTMIKKLKLAHEGR